MDTTMTTYDLGMLDREELFELRDLQAKTRDENARPVKGRTGSELEDLSKLTLEELLTLERLHRKMAGLPTREPTPPHVPVILTTKPTATEDAATTVTPKPPEAARAPAPAASPRSTPAPAATAEADKPKRPSDDVMSARSDSAGKKV